MSSEMMQTFIDDLNNDRFVLSSLPEVALNIRDALDDPNVGPNELAEIINRDPVIAAKVIKTANSVLYRGRYAAESIADSVVRMGLGTTRQLVLSFAMKELFQSGSSALNEATKTSWEHSMLVGAVGHALARHTGLCSTEEAMLAGILSNIGVLSVLNFVSNYPEIYEDKDLLAQTVDEMKTEVGAMVLDSWQFPAKFVACALQGENWQRDTRKPPDLCDLIIVASLHAYIGKREIPQIDTVPAFRKLSEARLSPEFAVNFMSAAREQINEARTLFSG